MIRSERLLHAIKITAVIAGMALITFSVLPWWVKKNTASWHMTHKSSAQAHQRILQLLQPDREPMHSPDAAAMLLRYLVSTGMEAEAQNLVPLASQSRSPNPLMWYDLARLAEANQQWAIASMAWPKAGFRANIEASLTGGQELIIDDFNDFSRWELHPGEHAVPVHIQFNEEGVVISYHDQLSLREQISYYLSFRDFTCPPDATIALDAWIGSNSFLTLDVVLDGKASRLIAYEPGANQWKIYRFQLPEGNFERILIGLGEPEGIVGAGVERQIRLRQLELELAPPIEERSP